MNEKMAVPKIAYEDQLAPISAGRIIAPRILICRWLLQDIADGNVDLAKTDAGPEEELEGTILRIKTDQGDLVYKLTRDDNILCGSCLKCYLAHWPD